MSTPGKGAGQMTGGEKQRAPLLKRRNAQDLFVGSRLREARQLRGHSQTVIADALGVSFQAIQKYENGENRISAGRLVKVAAFLDVPLTFFAQHSQAPVDKSAAAHVFNDDDLKLVRAYRAIKSEEVRAQVRRLIEVMARDAEARDVPGHDELAD
jgi:transcriptional regulator with XRE-family HTH domain